MVTEEVTDQDRRKSASKKTSSLWADVETDALDKVWMRYEVWGVWRMFFHACQSYNKSSENMKDQEDWQVRAKLLAFNCSTLHGNALWIEVSVMWINEEL